VFWSAGFEGIEPRYQLLTLVIEIFFTFFNTALSQSSIIALYPKKNMIKFSQQPVTKQQKIAFAPTI